MQAYGKTGRTFFTAQFKYDQFFITAKTEKTKINRCLFATNIYGEFDYSLHEPHCIS